MRKWMIAMAALGALGFLFAACGGSEEPKADEPKADEPKADEPKAEEPKAEEPKAEEDAAAGSPCDQWARCCGDYADAVGKMPGMTEDLVKMQKQGCESIEAMKAAPGGDESCKTAMDATKASASAYESNADFKMPESCN